MVEFLIGCGRGVPSVESRVAQAPYPQRLWAAKEVQELLVRVRRGRRTPLSSRLSEWAVHLGDRWSAHGLQHACWFVPYRAIEPEPQPSDRSAPGDKTELRLCTPLRCAACSK